MPNEKKYRIPKGVEVKPSQVGYYNYWYPSEEEMFLTTESVEGEFLFWRGSDKWAAVKVKKEVATKYQSPIQVLWIKREKAPIVRKRLKERGE